MLKPRVLSTDFPRLRSLRSCRISFLENDRELGVETEYSLHSERRPFRPDARGFPFLSTIGET